MMRDLSASGLTITLTADNRPAKTYMSSFIKLPLEVQRDFDKYAREIDADNNYIIDEQEMKKALRKYGLVKFSTQNTNVFRKDTLMNK